MKVLLINKYHYIKGGADAVFFNTKNLLESYGIETIEFCTNNSKNTRSKWEKYFVFAPEIRELTGWRKKAQQIIRFIWNRDAAKKLEKLIREERPDVAHLHNIFNGISLSILPVLKKHHVPVVVTMHDTRFICPSSYFNTRVWCNNCLKYGCVSCGLHRCYQDDFINSWMCTLEMMHKEKWFRYDKYIDHYIFVSKKFMQFYAERHNWFKEKGSVLYNFLPNQYDIDMSCNRGSYLLYYGRITKEKGIVTLVEAVKMLPNVRLIVAGDGPLLPNMKQKSIKNVEFVGFKRGDELFDLVKYASFVLVPSECEENNPLTIIESYSYGKPVIGSNMGGISEIIDDNITGFIFQAFSRSALADTIVKAINVTDEQYMQMAQQARLLAEKYFSPQTHYLRLMEIYDKVKNYENH